MEWDVPILERLMANATDLVRTDILRIREKIFFKNQMIQVVFTLILYLYTYLTCKHANKKILSKC